MEIKLEKVALKDKKILSRMIGIYRRELAKYRSEQDEERGYKYLDLYFLESNRHPFFIYIDENIAGFILVNLQDPFSNKQQCTIAEFYVEPEHRNKGVGKISAQKIFDMFKGKWIIRQLKGNPALSFWRKVIDEYTRGNFHEEKRDDEKWKGTVQIFDNS